MGTTARLDRVLLLGLGLLLTAAGVLGLLVGLGVFGAPSPDKPVFDNVVGRFVGDNGAWLWPVIAVAGLLLGYLALRWLVGQLRPTAVRDLQLEPRSTTGQTGLVSSAVTDAVTGEISRYRVVSSAGARLTGDELDPELRLRVQLDARADVAAIRRRIETEAVARVRQALDRPEMPVRLDLVVTDRRAARVG